MALVDDVKLRVPGQTLIEVTNPRGGASPTAIDETKLSQACSSIEARFGIYAQETYSSSVAIHVELCVEGAVSLLRKWGGNTYAASKAWWGEFREECERVAASRARGRIEPSTDSETTPTEENPTGIALRPWADDSAFRGLVPRRPGGGDDSDD